MALKGTLLNRSGETGAAGAAPTAAAGEPWQCIRCNSIVTGDECEICGMRREDNVETPRRRVLSEEEVRNSEPAAVPEEKKKSGGENRWLLYAVLIFLALALIFTAIMGQANACSELPAGETAETMTEASLLPETPEEIEWESEETEP